MPFGLQPWHLLIALVAIIVIMGPKRLPEIGQAMGKTLRGFKDELDGGPQAPTASVSATAAPSEPVAPAAATAPTPAPVAPPDQG
ncbi:MAG TPA: twin-arginine translocase TatA/TatE family subunit [Candidatus Sulfotelmatobacter sp.]|nr:twin-arginine translocase TatA/TatE family subunit [Candidatus Sulfotelmatobacter sp.]